MYLHNMHPMIETSRNKIGTLHFNFLFFQDDGFGNMLKIDIVQYVFSVLGE